MGEENMDHGVLMAKIGVLAEKVGALTDQLARDRVDRREERVADREATREWRIGIEAQIKSVSESADKRLSAVEELLARYPDGLTHAVAANTAARRRARYKDHTIIAALVLLIGKLLYDFITKGG